MTDRIDETMVIAWIDGELSPDDARRVADAVARDSALAALADTHRQVKMRFAAAFGPIADRPVAPPRSAPVVSLDAARSARAVRQLPRWAAPGAIAASLVVGLLIGQLGRPRGLSDQAEALALGPPLIQALDGQLSGEPGQVRIGLSFRDHQGAFCRSFTALHVQGVACRAGDSWQLRYGVPVTGGQGEYRMAGNDPVEAAIVTGMIEGAPLDAAAEREARAKGWRLQ